jgi:predicted nucleic acid-binding protein
VDKTNVALLQPPLDIGEAEALAQAQERGARYFLADDSTAREIGRRMGIEPVGTMRLIARLHLEGLAGEPRALARKLRKDLRFRISDSVIEDALLRAPEVI